MIFVSWSGVGGDAEVCGHVLALCPCGCGLALPVGLVVELRCKAELLGAVLLRLSDGKPAPVAGRLVYEDPARLMTAINGG